MGIVCTSLCTLGKYYNFCVGLGDMAQNIITIIFFISVDIDNYHDKCQILVILLPSGKRFHSMMAKERDLGDSSPRPSGS